MGIRKKRIVPIQQPIPQPVAAKAAGEVVNMGQMIKEANAPQQNNAIEQFFGSPSVQGILFALGEKLLSGGKAGAPQQQAPKTKEDLINELRGKRGVL